MYDETNKNAGVIARMSSNMEDCGGTSGKASEGECGGTSGENQYKKPTQPGKLMNVELNNIRYKVDTIWMNVENRVCKHMSWNIWWKVWMDVRNPLENNMSFPVLRMVAEQVEIKSK